MLKKSRELIFAAIAMLIITLAYLLIQTVTREIPAASGFWGHSLGVLGFVLMLMTETLYSLRKRSKRGARWGKMSGWLEFHIFTGLVGPYMVLLHPGWQFRGLAGVLSLLTVLMVISGFIGRYIYTAVPRAANGAQISLLELEHTARQLEAQLAGYQNQQDTRPRKKSNPEAAGSFTILTRFWSDLLAMLTNLGLRMQPASAARQQALAWAQVRRKYEQVERQISSQAAARRLLSLWHTVHIPLGLTLFLVALLHIGAAIYYAMLLY